MASPAPYPSGSPGGPYYSPVSQIPDQPHPTLVLPPISLANTGAPAHPISSPLLMAKILEGMQKDIASWKDGGTDGRLARRGRMIHDVARGMATVLNLVIAGVSGAGFQSDYHLSPAVPLALSVLTVCLTLVPNVFSSADGDEIQRHERISNAQQQAYYDGSELYEAAQLAMVADAENPLADNPSEFPLPNAHNLPLVPHGGGLASALNMLFKSIKDECHRASAGDEELRSGRSKRRRDAREAREEGRSARERHGEYTALVPEVSVKVDHGAEMSNHGAAGTNRVYGTL